MDEPPAQRASASPYVELRTRSAFSFLEGASLPADLATRAAELGYPALALCDREGLYGIPQFHRAARAAGIRAIVGAELLIRPAARRMDDQGADTTDDLTLARVAVLVTDRSAYRGLCRLLTLAKSRLSKADASSNGAPVTAAELAEHGRGLIALLPPGTSRAAATQLREGFARDDLYCELRRHRQREDGPRNRRSQELACELGLGTVATNDVGYATPDRAELHDVLACIRQKTTLEAAREQLPRHAERYLKAPHEMARLFADLPLALARTWEIAERCEFTLDDLGYRFPEYPLSVGHTADGKLADLVAEGLARRYPRPETLGSGAAAVGLAHRAPAAVLAQIDHELALIAKLGLAGYFLIVWDIVRFCREQQIMVQGRGSAANSTVCYVLGITAVDPVARGLLFERFLSEDRDEWPDIDLDLPSGELREQAIQYVFSRYGRSGAAMTANVITYRGRSAVRDVGKVLGIPQDPLDRLSRGLYHHDFRGSDPRTPDASSPVSSGVPLDTLVSEAGLDPATSQVRRLLALSTQIQDLPRHLGQHSGGMVVCQGRLDEIVPLEPATMPGRTVITWDKDDCADLGILKIDLLGLGMMGVLQDAVGLIRQAEGVEVDYARLPDDDPAIWDMLSAGDTVGVFQLESRAQMNILPRLQPRCFYDIVVSIGLIRPGPIVGKMVSPYLQRRCGREPAVYLHPDLESVLSRTLGVPIFQEQVMRMAMVMAGFSGAQAEQLRRAMGFKRSAQRMSDIEQQLRGGMAKRGVVGRVADEVVGHITSFAQYGFPEAHSCSFALLAFATAYLKAHHPEALLCGLLNHYPMGFYHPSTLIRDAQRHGVEVFAIDIAVSQWDCTLEAPPGSDPERAQRPAVRLGLRYVQGLREEAASQLRNERALRPFAGISDLMRRTWLRRDELEQLAAIGALGALGAGGGGSEHLAVGDGGLGRREALWQVQGLEAYRRGLLAGAEPDDDPFELVEMDAVEELMADYRGTTLSTRTHPLALLRDRLAQRGIVPAAGLDALPAGANVTVAGTVIVRNRPPTAKGMTFLSLEDETGLINIIVEPPCYARHRVAIVTSGGLILQGQLQRRDGVTHIRAQSIERLEDLGLRLASRDFH